MAGAHSFLKIPSIMTVLIVVASIFATAMLTVSYFSMLTPQTALKRGDPVDRVQAVEHLIKQGRNGVPDLVHAIKHYHRETRITSLFGLGRIGLQASDAFDDVCIALRDDDPSVRSVAVATLWQICPDPRRTVPILIPMSIDSQQSVRNAVEKGASGNRSAGSDVVVGITSPPNGIDSKSVVADRVEDCQNEPEVRNHSVDSKPARSLESSHSR